MLGCLFIWFIINVPSCHHLKKVNFVLQMKNQAKYFFLLVASFQIQLAFSQTLNLPPRASTALSGSQFVVTISSPSMGLTTRENLILAEISNGNVPDFYRTLVPVTSTAIINSTIQSVTYYVIPDYLAVGCDTDYFLCPMSPMLASQIGTLTGCTLPTRKMVNDIWSSATVKLDPSPIPASPSMTTVPVFDQHNTTVGGQRQAVIGLHPLGELVSGDKKDVVISNLIYATANRVVIYGWHYTNGNPIQPLTNVHSDTYMDYSHGIRLVQDSCLLNNTTATTVQLILQSSTFNPVLSDEGQISQPYYPYNLPVTQLSTPVSFAVLQNTSTTLKIKVANDVDVSDYKIYTSSNGITFNAPVTLPKTNLVVTGLSSNNICFIKIAAYNATYGITSSISEVLAAVPSSTNDSVLIVNGFDRVTSGNTFNFIIQHGNAFFNNQHYFESATNEAVADGLVSLSDYKTVDYILGKESSANETFNSSEQILVSNYLKQGGHLFVSGSEIGWDLDHLGNAADKSFFNNYLKSSYAFDAPNNLSSTFYGVYNSTLSSTIFNAIDSVNYDNGTHGTYNVDYPDVINPLNGGVADLHYSTNITDFAGIHFQGIFPGGSEEGKLVYLCFPFETIYNSAKRDSVVSRIIYFFDHSPVMTNVESNEKDFVSDVTIFPNPCNEIANVSCNLPDKNDGGILNIYNSNGELIRTALIAAQQTISSINVSEWAEGLYFINVVQKDNLVGKGKLVVMKR